MNPMIVQYGEISRNKDKHSSRYNKDDTFNVTKVAARKSILMQITKVRAASLFH
jgi:hypothetical protein